NINMAYPLINNLIERQVVLSSTHINLILQNGSIEQISDFIQKTQITITRDHFIAVITSNPEFTIGCQCDKYIFRCRVRGYKQLRSRPQYQCGYCDALTAQKNIKIQKSTVFRLYGLILNYDDVILAIKHGVRIEHAQGLSHLADDQMVEQAYLHDTFPEMKFSCVSEQLIGLYEAVRLGKYTDVRKMLKNNRIKPDKLSILI